jgi:virginiamycin B lyase
VRRVVLAFTILAVATLALAARADAFVYWTDLKLSSIGRANLDGSGVIPSLILDGQQPLGVAVDGAHVYWAGQSFIHQSTIGRAKLDGTDVEEGFIGLGSGSYPTGVAVDGAHLYWADFQRGAIGRANLDGTGVNPSFITGASFPTAVAVDGAHVYWTNTLGIGVTNSIGRANLDGTGVQQRFIGGASNPQGVAVDADHVYWTNFDTNTIGRANLDGTGVNHSFITGASGPVGVALDRAPTTNLARFIYWANSGAGTIGYAFFDASFVDQNLITGISSPHAVAVDLGAPGAPPPPSPPAFGARTRVTLGLAKQRLAAGGPLPVRVRNANRFTVTGGLSARTLKKVKTPTRRFIKLKAKAFRVGAHAKTTVKLRLPKPLRQVLDRRHKVRLQLIAKVKDPAGHTRRLKKRVTVRLKRAR